MNHNRLHNPDRIALNSLLPGSSMLVTLGNGRRAVINLHRFASKHGFKIRTRKVSGVGLEVTRITR